MSERSPHRAERVSQLLKEEVGKLIFTILEDHRDAFLTVTRVKTAADHAHATIFVSALAKAHEAEALAELKRNIGAIQRALNRALRMRPVPKISFAIDKAHEAETRVHEILSHHDDPVR